MSALNLYCICRHPEDHPNHYTIRKHVINGRGKKNTFIDPDYFFKADTLEQCREHLAPMGLHCIPRSTGDDLVIVESWL